MLSNRRFLLLLSLLAVLVLMVACARATPTPPATPRPTATATAAPTATTAQVAPTATSTRAAATATPTQAVPPTPTATRVPEVREETVTVLVGSWGNSVFDPIRAVGETLSYQRLMQAWLVEGGGGSQAMIPGIAKGWEVSKDGKTWTFTVRSGVKAHNGEEINVDDVFGNLDVRYGVKSQNRTGYAHTPDMDIQRALVKLEKVAPDKVVWETKAAWLEQPWRMSSSSAGPSGAIVPQDYWDKVGEEGYEKNPVGAGPFKLVSYKPDQEFVFERFEDYYYQPKNGFPEDRRPKFRRLVMRLVPEPATRAAAIQAGQADLVVANLFMVKDIERAGGRVVYAQESAYNWVVFVDCWDPALWCYKKEVRQALEYAVDKETIVKNLYGPDAAVVKGWVSVTPSSLGYVPGVTDPFPYNVDKAKALLAQAGFTDGKGIPTVKIYTWESTTVPLMPQLAQVVVDYWKKVGVQSEVVVGDATTIRTMQRDRKIPGTILIRDNETRWTGFTWTYYTDPKNKGKTCDRTMSAECEAMAKLIEEKYVNAPVRPLEQYGDIFKELYTALRDDSHQTAFFYVNMPWGLGSRVKDYKPWSLVSYLTAIWTLELK